MNRKSMLIDYFGVLFNEKSKVKQLKQIILELAFRGKLVEQDSNDEPVSLLIEKINKEKNELVKSGKINNQKQFLDITADEIPYELPNGWEWVRVGFVGYNLGQKIPDIEFNYIDVGSINKELGIITQELNIVKPEDAPSRARKLVDYGTIIYSTVRPYLLNVAIVDRNFDYKPIVSTAFAVIHPHSNISTKYIYYYLRSPEFVRYVESKMVGMAYPAINDGNFFNGIIPLPPANEQIRIVEKLEHLLGLCEALEVNLKVNEENLELAGRSILFNINNFDPSKSLYGLKLLIENFGELSINERNVKNFRQSVLQQAVQGKLIPQDPNDEPASVLLEKIKAEKEQLIKEKKTKKEKPLPPITENETPYELPKGWEWVRFQEINEIASNLVAPDNYLDMPHIAPDNIEKGTGKLINYQSIRESGVTSSKHLFYEGQILYSKIRPKLSKLIIVDFDGLCSADMYPINTRINIRYLFRFMMSQTFLDMAVKTDTRVAMPKINQNELNKIVVPVPPLNEQKRIVEKVDQLMALCDELEKSVEQSNKESEMLMRSVLQETFYSSAQENNIVKFPIAHTIDKEDWEIAARSDGDIDSETKVKIKNRVTELLSKSQQ